MTALEIRAADPQQPAMPHTYLSDAALPSGSRVLEIGCGTGAVTRALAAWPGVAEAIGVDPSPVCIAKARELARGSLRLGDNTFDAVVLPTTLCHAPEPEAMLHEAVRNLGADALGTAGRIGADRAAALKAEARRRVASGEYFGHIAYMSLVARKSA